MPLLPGSLVVAPPPEIITPPTTPYLQTVGRPAFTWYDPDGREWPLSNAAEDLGWFTLMGPSGWGAAPIEITTDSLPRGGESVRAIASKPSTIQWPMEVFGRNHDEFVQRYRRISRAFKLTTRRGRPGVLRVQRQDGSVREIEAFYSDGLGGEAEQNHLFARPVITLFCPDGKWRAPGPLLIERHFTPTGGGGEGGGGGTPVTFFAPYLSVTSSQLVGTPGGGQDESPGDGGGSGGDNPDSLTAITNPGDVEGWPAWTITGPMTQLRAWNVTLGTQFTLTYVLSDLQTIQITTDQPTVRGPGDANLSRYIDWFNPAGAELWPLTDGQNLVGLEVDGAGTNTKILMSFVPRYDDC